MLQTVKDACQFDPKAIDYALSDQIESLEDLVGHDAGAAEAFFKKTYVTGGMRTLLRQGLQRLAGSSGQAVFELKQSMGGGKTHSMLALGYLARQSRPRASRPQGNHRKASRRPRRASSRFPGARSRATSTFGATSPSSSARPREFVEFYKGSPKAPNEKDWVGLIGDEPTLILLDELPPYFGYGVTQPVGGGTLADVTVYARLEPALRGAEAEAPLRRHLEPLGQLPRRVASRSPR